MLINGASILKEFAGIKVLQNVSLQINEGDRIGIVGENGTGKTTLLNILSTSMQPDNGTVSMKKGLRIGYVKQLNETNHESSVYEFIRNGDERIIELEKQLNKFETGIECNQEHYQELLHKFEHLDGYKYNARVSNIIKGMGLEHLTNRRLDQLSGGEKRRVLLAKVFASDSDVMFLDEPTNHLDIYAVSWLEQFLSSTKSAFVLVSHDRMLLDKCVNKIIEINNKKLHSFSGNYSFYLKEREERLLLHKKEYEKQQEMIKREEEFIRRNLEGQKTKQAQARRKKLEKIQLLEREVFRDKTYKLTFNYTNNKSKDIIKVENLSIGYNNALVKNINFFIRRGERYGIVGRNGSGKTTFLKTMAGELKPLEGTIKKPTNTKIMYFSQDVELPLENGSVFEQILAINPLMKRGDVLSYLAGFYFREADVDKPVKALSGGERSRLKMAVLMLTPADFLILDEPTNHLDMKLRETVMNALKEFEGSVFIVSHDRYFLDNVIDEVLEFENGKFNHYNGNISYFLAKKKEKEQRLKTETLQSEKNSGNKNKNEEKKQPAISKNELMRAKKRFQEVENLITAKESEKEKLLASLEKSEIFLNPDKLKEVNSKIKETDKQLEKLFEEWEKLSEICS
jgi:ATP-binding cassette subfamily F protein 3